MASTFQGGVGTKIKGEDRLIGDYPDVPVEYTQYRNTYKPWFDKQNKREFNEDLHQNYDLLDGWSPDRFDLVPDSTAVKNNLYFATGVVSFLGLIYFFFYPERPAIKRDYPHGGLYKALGGTEETKDVFAAPQDKEYS